MATEPDDPIARALAEAGLAPFPGDEPDDPLARALAAAGLTDDEPEPDDPEPEAQAAEALAALAPNVVRDRPTEEAAPTVLPHWPVGVATGVGSMPGTDPREASSVVVGETPGMPALPELPARGVGADMIGRTAGMLVDIAVEVKAARYTVCARPGRDDRRARDFLRHDLDAFDDACDRIGPEWVKVAAAGPWTLSAAVELPTGHRVLTDRGAVREFAASLVAGLKLQMAEVAARTKAHVVVQLDEPGLPAVLAGALPTPSGYGRVSAVPEPVAQDLLREVVDELVAAGSPVVVHCCADRPPLDLLLGTGAAAIGIDARVPALNGPTAQVTALDAVGRVWDAGVPLFLGAVPARAPRRPVTSRELAQPVFEIASRLGFAREQLAELAVPTPTCGLAGADAAWARTALGLARELGAGFVDPPDGPGETGTDG